MARKSTRIDWIKARNAMRKRIVSALRKVPHVLTTEGHYELWVHSDGEIRLSLVDPRMMPTGNVA